MVSTAEIDCSQLGCLDGITIAAIESIFARLDELLWHFPILPPVPRVGELVATAHPNVLLEIAM
jgi:hypothetical protein